MRDAQPAPLRRQLAVLATVAAFCFGIVTGAGCFDTYRFKPEEFAKLQRPEEVPRTVTDTDGEQVVVNRGTAMYVRSTGGRRYPITAYNFKLTGSQLVASDRDTLLALSDIDSYEVDLLSTWKTATLITAGVAVVAGLIVFTVVTAE